MRGGGTFSPYSKHVSNMGGGILGAKNCPFKNITNLGDQEASQEMFYKSTESSWTDVILSNM